LTGNTGAGEERGEKIETRSPLDGSLGNLPNSYRLLSQFGYHTVFHFEKLSFKNNYDEIKIACDA